MSNEGYELDGYDPYSNSKSCSELVTHSYRQSFFGDNLTAISTARAGNVIGGVDNLIISEKDLNLMSFKEYTQKMRQG